MPRDYRKERDLIVQRWYGRKPTGRNPRPLRSCRKIRFARKMGSGLRTRPTTPFHSSGTALPGDTRWIRTGTARRQLTAIEKRYTAPSTGRLAGRYQKASR